jgi:hypothetical protein
MHLITNYLDMSLMSAIFVALHNFWIKFCCMGFVPINARFPESHTTEYLFAFDLQDWNLYLLISSHSPIFFTRTYMGPSWSCSYGHWIYNLFNQCLSQITLWVRIPFRRCVLDKHYVIKLISYLREVGCFFRVLRFLSPIQMTATI